jgi:uncharacterized protein
MTDVANSNPNPRSSEERNRVRSTRFERFFMQNILNAMSSRTIGSRGVGDPRRDIDDECGYPRSVGGLIDIEEYQRLYDREAIASRVVEVYPKESWQVQPQVYEDENPEVITEFEEAWINLADELDGEENYHQEELGSPIWDYLQRLDILSGIGHYGVLLIGVNDNKELKDPIPINLGNKKVLNLTFLTPIPESLATISAYEGNMNSPRFGMPVEYNVSLIDNNSQQASSVGAGLNVSTTKVHWSRIIHVADNAGKNKVYGVPRMQPVLNRLYDLRKLYSGSAEMYWKGAFPGFSFETQANLGGDPDMDAETLKDEIEDYMNGLQRYLRLQGMIAKSLAPQVVDPTPQINTQIEAICIQLGIPKRIFMGSERGELASSQDDAAWNDRLRFREKYFITPRIIRQFVNRLISIGVLPKPMGNKKNIKRTRKAGGRPSGGYTIFWPDLTSQTAQEKSAVTFQLTQALAQYTTSGAHNAMAPTDYFTRVWGMNENEARSVVDNAPGIPDKTNPLKGQISVDTPIGSGSDGFSNVVIDG